MDRRQLFIPVFIILIAAAVRIAFLDIKPPHFDEGINGWFCDQMAIHGYYKYDPSNYHGPLHFYVLFIFLKLFGRNLWALRMPVVLIGTLTVGWLLLFRRFVGKPIAYLAALGMALSPGFIFYQRYSIHETWLTFFLIVTFWGILGIYSTMAPKYIYALVLGITGMILTKETYLIHGLIFAVAVPIAYALERFYPSEMPVEVQRESFSWFHFNRALILGLFLIVFFYSGTFLYWQGLRDLAKTFIFWAHTGVAGNGHEKLAYDLSLPGIGPLSFGPFTLNWYWIFLLLNYEWLAVLGLLFSARYLVGGNIFLRYLAIYAAGTLIAYSIIPYKTPWCIISIAWPYLFLGAAFLCFIWNSIPKRVTLTLVLAGLYAAATLFLFVHSHGFGHVRTYWVLSLIGLILFLGGALLGIRPNFAQVLLALVLTLLLVRGVTWLFHFHRFTSFPVSFDVIFLACLGAFLSLFWMYSSRAFGVVLAVVTFAFMTSQSIALNFFRFDNSKEPYAYVQTFREYRKLVDPILKKLSQDPGERERLRGTILLKSYFPIPWVLGDVRSIGYYSDPRTWPESLNADFIVVESDQAADLNSRLHDPYFVVPFRLRDALGECKAYFRCDVFHDLFPGRAPDFTPAPEPAQ